MSEKVCYCGNPVPKGKSKYCSDECRIRLYNRNLGKRVIDEDETPPGYENMPEGFVGAWLTPDELKQRNKELERYGRRICTDHQGAALPLDAEHFYYRSKAEGTFRHDCKVCTRKSERERYYVRRADPDTVARIRELARTRARRYRRMSPERREAARLARKERHLRRKYEQVARVLGLAS